ncbi:MAG TPA: hypothetical protein VFO01_13910 [Trebonia sp.]|nr:hypothetical protein [Trebonia sp.]
MVAPNSAAPLADQPTASVGGITLRVSSWLLERKLYRRTRADLARVAGKVVAIRLYSAAACFISMLLAAWVGAFARVVSAHDWHTFRTLDGATLITVSAKAGRYQGYLLPVLLAWAIILLLTPIGYTFAFRTAAVASGILGYLHLSPPAFWVTARVTAVSHWLARFDNDGSRYSILFLISSIGVAYVLQQSAVRMFEHLDQLPTRPGREPHGSSSPLGLLRKPFAMLLILLVLESVTWAATVIRLAAAGASTFGSGMSYGLQGGLYQSRYLLVLAIIAVILPRLDDAENWLAVAVALTALYGLAPDVLPFPSILGTAAARRELTRIGTAWGDGSLWAALFVFIPASMFGVYLVGKLLRSP